MWLMYSVLAAFSFGLRGILYHWTSQQSLNRNVLLCGTFFMGALISGICAILLQQTWTVSALIGVQMGLFSFGANASMFKGFAVGKASLVAILTGLPSVVVVFVAYLIWDERLNMMQFVAFVIIVIGILVVRYSNEITLKNLQGAGWGALALILFAGNDLSGKWTALVAAPLFPTLFCMFTTGTICFGLWWLKDQKQGDNKQAKAATSSGWTERRTFLFGMVVGITNVVGMIFILHGFDHGKAGLVSAVVALNVLIVLLYTRFVLKDKFSMMEQSGLALAFIGILMMKLVAS
ncbi:EamA family transporter [Paenibacillus aceris]|uniref:Drug/metabolite transporter (DMT)-like permease n=1 Tax=Paenibacillus aceris TaxID=869555 RepID=A0ABS4HU73_9BACL|nr:EamA family transporter [Paenibacillus aceris]MBP1962170.1 drug/metabolite transporter (DMT)-like permease [Paenibacillus aceris]NHW33983.1 EamA family transporter [Paenibacillus aceris]